MLNIHEFGAQNSKILLMFHGSCMVWDMYAEAIESLAGRFHVVIPALPGHDPETDEDFTSVKRKKRAWNERSFSAFQGDCTDQRDQKDFSLSEEKLRQKAEKLNRHRCFRMLKDHGYRYADELILGRFHCLKIETQPQKTAHAVLFLYAAG